MGIQRQRCMTVCSAKTSAIDGYKKANASNVTAPAPHAEYNRPKREMEATKMPPAKGIRATNSKFIKTDNPACRKRDFSTNGISFDSYNLTMVIMTGMDLFYRMADQIRVVFSGIACNPIESEMQCG